MIKKYRNKKGFTLAELLLVVAILIILFAIGVPAIFTIQKNLRQTELDAKAETVFVSVQNRLTKMKAGGYTDVFQYKNGNGVYMIDPLPGDITEGDNIKANSLCYFTSEDYKTPSSDTASAARSVMTSDVMDAELLNNNWVIEYNPETAIVYAVFYSEDKGNCAEEYAPNSQLYNLTLRVSKDNRLDDGARIGYYGGGSGKESSTTKQLYPTATLTNNEKLTLTASVSRPDGVSDYPVIRVKLTDGEGNVFYEYFAYYGCSEDYIKKINIEAAKTGPYRIDYDLLKKNGATNEFSLELVLDDLSSESTRFASLYKDKLTPGTSLQIEVSAICPGNRLVKEGKVSTINTNSLFADDSTDDTANIVYGRHLQNLDASSGLTDKITKARQESDISFSNRDNKSGLEDWYETYSEDYSSENSFFNQQTGDENANFKPIVNTNLISYDGNNKTIKGLREESDESQAGLFATLTGGQTVKDLKMTGTDISVATAAGHTAAGAIAGTVDGGEAAVTIENCQVYLTDDERLGKDNHDVWIGAKYAGGLIGRVEEGGKLRITKSAASTVIGEYTYTESIGADDKKKTSVQAMSAVSAGGLVGYTGDSADITIEESYADNYLVGRYAGGLIGISEGTSVISGSYAAGYLTYTSRGAGMVLGSAQMDHSYTIMHLNDMNDDSGTPYYRTAVSGTSNKVYYAAEHVNNMVELGEEMLAGYTIAQLKGFLNDGGTEYFTDKTGNSTAYNLMDQALGKYTYPALKNVRHYGDWQADFQAGALVYYEKYVNNTTGEVSYGFYGANVESTLKDDAGLTVVGDGYGIVYKDNVPVSADITVSDPANSANSYTQTLTFAGASSYEIDTVDSKYYIYPLSVDGVNNWSTPSSGYYLKAVVEATAASGDKSTEYYYFNPHFAKTVYQAQEDEEVPAITADTVIAVRTARHLYMMSLYYDTYAQATSSATYKQERNIDYASYDWSDFSTRADKDSNPSSQAPIAGNDTPFISTYDGGCNYITNVSIVTSEGNYVGFFGRNSGIIRNCVLRASYSTAEGASNYYVARTGNIQTNDTICMGIVTGINEAGGSITNCSTDGYYVAGRQATIFAYENSNLYAGGIAGINRGVITSSAVDVPKIRASSTFANVRLGGFTGSNTGTISDCYAIGTLEMAISRGGSAVLAGFTSSNRGLISNSYCAVSLTSVGENSATYGFTSTGGSVQNCRYLDKSSFKYIGTNYSADSEDQTAVSTSFSDLTVGSGDSGKAVYSYSFGQLTPSSESYPFRAVVRNASGQKVHYGDWMTELDLGTVGFFYWEHETEGQNNGYHLTYIAEKEHEDGTTSYISGSTLCDSHSDNGVISEYGYGYFTSKYSPTPTVSSQYIGGFNDSNVNVVASAALQTQMSEYNFVAYTTKDAFTENASGLILDVSSVSDASQRATITEGSMTVNGYTCSFTPFFANSMNCTSFSGITVTDKAGNTSDYNTTSGTAANQYEIRSASQLQYINWNNNTQRTDEYLRKDTGWFVNDTAEDSANKTNDNVISFPYLGYAYAQGSNTMLHHAADYYWQQTHDVNANMPTDNSVLFAPIGSAYDSMQQTTTNTTYMYTAFFNGTYTGDSYRISNIQIDSRSQAVGLFGEVINAKIDGLILYSDQDNIIQTDKDGKGFYNMGCLAGMALKGGSWIDAYRKADAGITNCSVSGYIMQDNRANHGYGGANEGGLVGLCALDVNRCSAAVDIQINVTYSNSGRYVRVGGLAGSFRGYTLQNCYAGGSIEEPYLSTGSATLTMVGGLANVGFLRTAGNLSSLFGAFTDCPTFSNCYVYTDLSSINRNSGCVAALCPVVSTGNKEHEHTKNTSPTHGQGAGTFADVSNCYYYSAADVSYKYRTADVGIYNASSQESGQADVADCAMRVTYDELSGSVNLGQDIMSYDAVKTSTYNNKKIDTALNAGSASPWSWVTTVEGSGVAIDGKYSYPGSDLRLEGMNYPFPTVITQRDLVFGGSVNVHYGSWPVKGTYWEKGRDTMDIFSDMVTDTGAENEGYAVKVFKLYAPKNVSTYQAPEVSDFVIDTKDDSQRTDGEVLRARVVAVGAAESDSTGTYYPVTIMAYNTGTAKVIYMDDAYDDAAFNLEITANLYAVSTPNTVELPDDEKESFTLQAVSEVDTDGQPSASAKHFETTGKWVETVNQESILSLNGTVISSDTTRYPEAKESVELTPDQGKVSCEVERAGLGDSIITSSFTYTYHNTMVWSKAANAYIEKSDDKGQAVPLTFSAVAYVEVSQPDMVGMSDSNTYNAAYLTDKAELSPVAGEERTYDIEIPAVTGSDFFMYLRSDSASLGSSGIQAVYVKGQQAVLKDGEYVAGDTNEEYHVTFGSLTSDSTYTYMAGTIVCRTTGDDISEKRNVALRVVTRINGIDYDLTVNMKKVKTEKFVVLTYEDGSDHSYTENLLTGETVLLTEDDAALSSFVTPRFKHLTGWKVKGTEEVYKPGDRYNLTESVTFEAVYSYIEPVLNANGGMFDDYEDTLTVTWSMMDDQTNGTFNILPYSSGRKGTTDVNHAVQDGYHIIGWHTSPTLTEGEKPAYDADAVVSLEDDALKSSGYVLYAIWEKDD